MGWKCAGGEWREAGWNCFTAACNLSSISAVEQKCFSSLRSLSKNHLYASTEFAGKVFLKQSIHYSGTCVMKYLKIAFVFTLLSWASKTTPVRRGLERRNKKNEPSGISPFRLSINLFLQRTGMWVSECECESENTRVDLLLFYHHIGFCFMISQG